MRRNTKRNRLSSEAPTEPLDPAIIARARRAEAQRLNADLVRRIETREQGTHEHHEHDVHSRADAAKKLEETIRNLALISENVEDRSAVDTKVEILKPISIRERKRFKLARSKPFRGLAPQDTVEIRQYTLGEHSHPLRHPEPLEAQHRKEREARGWVVPLFGGGGVPYSRQPLAPSRHRPSDLIIEIPDGNDPHSRIRSWLGGQVAIDGQPKPGTDHPLIIATGPDGDGTSFHKHGIKGLTTGFYGDRAIEGLTAVGDPDSAYMQTHKLLNLADVKLKIVENRILDQIALEHGVENSRTPQRPTSHP